MEIRREKTAISRKKPSSPLLWAMERNLLESVVYDWGCGKGKDSEWLEEQEFCVIPYDPYYCDDFSPEAVNFEEINTILLFYVLNIIENVKERKELLADIGRFAKPESKIIIAVPTFRSVEYRANKSNWKVLSDGYLTKSSTFQKGYSLGEFVDECSIAGKIRQIDRVNSFLVGVVEIEE